MQNMCRTCMGDSVPLVNIFSDVRDPALEQPERNLSDIISECTNRPVRRSDFQPQFICLTCVQAAQTAFRFKRQCDHSHRRLCELQNNEGNQDRDIKQAEHKEAPRAEDSRSDSARHDGTNNKQRKLCQTLDGTKRTKNVYNVVGNRFVCSYCSHTYKTTSGLKRHMLIHTSKPDHKCPSCSKVFWRKDAYIGHLLTHGIRSFVSCTRCPTVCPDATHLEIHMREHNGGAAEKTISVPNDFNLETDNIDMINKENNLNAIAENLPLLKTVHKNLCNLCSDSFIFEDELRMHRILVHDINATKNKNKKYMQQHQATHFSKPKHHCPVCSKTFWQRFRLTRHLRSHDKEGPYPCRQCSAIFIDHNQFKMHQSEHEEKIVGDKFPVPKNSDNNIDKTYDLRIRRMLNCNINDTNPASGSTTIWRDWEPEDLNLSQESSTIDDSSTQRSEDNPTSSQIESGFAQDTTSSGQGEERKKFSNTKEKGVCQTTYKNKRGMRRHLNTHTLKPKYTCSFCSKTFGRKYNMSRHLRTHVDNGVNVQYPCDLCPAKFVERYNLNRHKRQVH